MKALLLFLVSFPLLADDHCSFNFDGAKSAFKQNAKLYQKMSPIKKDNTKKILTQTVTTATGTVVTFTKGGCAHYAYSFKIRPKKITHKKPEKLFIQTLRELRALPLEDQNEVGIFTSALDRTKWKTIKFQDGHYDLDCGDATCELKTIKEKEVEREIEISYDFAL